MGSKEGRSHVVRFYGMSKNSWSPIGTNRQNYNFLLPIWQSSQELALAELGCSLGQIHPFNLHPCRWANHPHRVLKRFIETMVPPGTPDAVLAQTGTGKKKSTWNKATFYRSVLPLPSMWWVEIVRTSETSVYFNDISQRYCTEGCHL
jgi:hypothetical protein